MADVKYRVDIDTKGAQSAINSLGNTIKTVGASIAGAFAFKEVTQTGAKLDDLRRTFGTLYKSVETGSKAFRDTQKLAEQLGLNVDTLATTVIKLKSAGIEPTVAQLKLFSDVSKSSVDSVGALQAITDLFTRTMSGGLGLEDLERLQDRGIPVYTILAEKAGVARNEISELGQTMEGASRIRGILAEGLNEMFGGATESRANSMSTAFVNLQNAIKKSSDTLTQGGFGQALSEIVNRLAGWINSNQKLIDQLGRGLLIAVNFVIEHIKVLIQVLGVLTAVAITNRIVDMGVAFVKLAKAIRSAAVAGTILQGVTGVGLVKAIAGIAGATAAVLAIDKAFEDAEESASALNDQMSDIEGSKIDLELFQPGQIDKAVTDLTDLNDAFRVFLLEQKDLVGAFEVSNAERRQSIQLETKLLGTSREYQELRRAEADIMKNLVTETSKLIQEKEKLTQTEIDQKKAQAIDETIIKLQKKADREMEFTRRAIEESEARKAAYEIEQYAERERIRQSQLSMDMYDKQARLTLNQLELAYRDIEEAARDSANAQVDAMEAALGRDITDTELNKIHRIAEKNSEALKKQQKELYEESRRFSTGWKRAFNDYADDATNAAKMAERAFVKTTQTMEDAIVDFAKTGKFEFKGFMNSIVEELLRSQIRQLIASTFGGIGNIFTPGGGIGGGGNIFSGIKSFFGFANGGIIPNNSPVLVGERGPELLMNAGGSRVVPNNQLGQVVNYNINAVDAQSFKQMIARDPSFIHAVAMQGGKSMPQTRR